MNLKKGFDEKNQIFQKKYIQKMNGMKKNIHGKNNM